MNTVINVLNLDTKSSVTVISARSVGMAGIFAVKIKGCAVIIVVDRVYARLKKAK